MEETTTAPVTQTVATTSVADAAPDLGVVKDLAGGNPIVTVVLVLALIVGGPAGWKFWNARQKAKSDLEEKRLELEAKVRLAEIKAEETPKKKKGKKKEE
jgi:hypothetical protein